MPSAALIVASIKEKRKHKISAEFPGRKKGRPAGSRFMKAKKARKRSGKRGPPNEGGWPKGLIGGKPVARGDRGQISITRESRKSKKRVRWAAIPKGVAKKRKCTPLNNSALTYRKGGDQCCRGEKMKEDAQAAKRSSPAEKTRSWGGKGGKHADPVNETAHGQAPDATKESAVGTRRLCRRGKGG